MKVGLLIAGVLTMTVLSACGGGGQSANAPDPALQKQADVAKATLQEKADAMARQGSMSPPPPAEKKM